MTESLLKFTKTTYFQYLKFSGEVKDALEGGLPIVALESTIISHGLPYPDNLAIAKELEQIVRSNGAVPATIAIANGFIHVGLEEDILNQLASPSSKVLKVSRRDIAYVLAKGCVGATTVAATSLIASMVGIHVFATGGIGGVHRNGHISMDISNDLTELGRCPILVCSAGCKSILDIGRTLEFLETQGVSVLGYKTDNFPAFFVPDSGFKVPLRVDSPEECAKILNININLELNSGILVAIPIPEEFAAEGELVERCTLQALEESKEITGRDVTPFLLKRIAELSGGVSLRANLNLIRNNTKVASLIAIELSKLRGTKT